MQTAPNALRARIRAVDPTLAAACGALLLLAVLAWGRRWMSDDGFIYLRVVDNVLNGHGPVFNAGERVEAATSPIWVAMLTLAAGVLRFASEEWIAVVLGLALTLGGVAAGMRGSLLLWRGLGREGFALPAGALVVAAISPYWDFATSGLETGLSIAWLGVSFWALAALATERAGRWTAGHAAFLIGLGPLVRPDFALFSLTFLAALAVACRPDRRRALRLLAAAAALPVAYQVFRMGYYGALVPAPAFAKEASEAFWSRGFKYVGDFLVPYGVFVPVGALAAYAAVEVRRLRPPRPTTALAAAAVVGAALHVLYVARVGGDFMHGRLVLPGLFAVLLPVMTVVPSRRHAIALAAVLIPWAAVSIATLRPLESGAQGVIDERQYYVEKTGSEKPVTVADYEGILTRDTGVFLHGLAERERAIVHEQAPGGTRLPAPPPRRGLPTRVVTTWATVGVVSYAAGDDVHVMDRIGLGDAVAGRVRVAPGRPDRPGHEKDLKAEWMHARYGDPAGYHVLDPGYRARVEAARRALDCGDLRRVVAATDLPLTPGRFVKNLRLAVVLHGFRMPGDPVAAEQELCR